MAVPSWVTKSLTLVAENPSDVEWLYGRPQKIRREYFIEVEIPSSLTTSAQRAAWFETNIEGAVLSSGTSPFLGVPLAGSVHPVHTGLKVTTHNVTAKGYLSKRVGITVTYEIPEVAPSNQTQNGQVTTPFGSWNVQVSWTNAKLSGADYRGKPFMTVAGEIVNVQSNVAMFTLTRSMKTSTEDVVSPSINAVAVTRAGIDIPKHCGLWVQSNVENTGQDAGDSARIVTDQIIYIPRMINVTEGEIVNADTETNGIQTLADVGSYDILMLHQGYREKVNGKVDYVSYFDKTLGKKMTVHGLSVLDATGAHVVPDPDTDEVTPYYLAFQVYPATTW